MLTWSGFCAWYSANATSIPRRVREQIRKEAIDRRYRRMAGESVQPDGYADLVDRGESAMMPN